MINDTSKASPAQYLSIYGETIHCIQYTNVGPIFLRTPAMTIGNVGSVIENLDGGTKNKKILKNLKVSTVSISVAVSVTDSVCHSPCLCHYHYLQP